ncbi:MAG: PH domain-containing protein [Hyphomonadaceae bacterium]
MNYIDHQLADGETILVRGEFSWVQKALPWLALVFLGVVLVGIYLWVRESVRLATTEMVVTNRRLIVKKGLFNVDLDELTLGSLEGAHIDQSFLGRMFGMGRLLVRGRGETQLHFPTMAHPARFLAAAETARIEAERRGELPPADPPSPQSKAKAKSGAKSKTASRPRRGLFG